MVVVARRDEGDEGLCKDTTISFQCISILDREHEIRSSFSKAVPIESSSLQIEAQVEQTGQRRDPPGSTETMRVTRISDTQTKHSTSCPVHCH